MGPVQFRRRNYGAGSFGMGRAAHVIGSHSSPPTVTSWSMESKPLQVGPGSTNEFPGVS